MNFLNFSQKIFSDKRANKNGGRREKAGRRGRREVNFGLGRSDEGRHTQMDTFQRLGENYTDNQLMIMISLVGLI